MNRYPYFYRQPKVRARSRQAAGLIHAWNALSHSGFRDGALGGVADVHDWRGHLTGTWPSGLGTARDAQFGSVLSFDGTIGSVVNCGTITPKDEGAICFWMKAATPAGTTEVMGRGSDYEIEILSTGKLRHKIGNNGFASTANATGAGWVHVACTWRLTERKTYLNGRLDATNTTTVSVGTAGTFYLGRGSVGSPYFEGQLHDVRIYNRTLTAGEVFSIFAPQTRWDLWERPFYDVPLVLPVPVMTPAVLPISFAIPAPTVATPGVAVSIAQPLKLSFDVFAGAVVVDGVTIAADVLRIALRLPLLSLVTGVAAVAGTTLYTQTRDVVFVTHERLADFSGQVRDVDLQTHERLAEASGQVRDVAFVTQRKE